MAQTSRRKTVTVLFSDLVESTTLAESMDPEALAERLSGYFADMRGIIERHGGTVEKFIGDAVVGMFGVTATHEDDALRAVRAALEMHEAIEGSDIAARIGVNTGEVAVTGESNDGHLALGHAINMAARLEQAAAPGNVWIGSRTFELVSGAVVAQAIGSLTVKGSTEPIDAWRVTGLREGSLRGWHGEGLFVGRARELESIMSAFESTVTNRACCVVTVVAPAGMGKSRLAAEATRRLAESALVLVGRCAPYGEGTTYKPLVEIASSVELADDSDNVVRARQALSDTALASPEEAAWVFKQLLEAEAEQRPVVAVIDDLHWAEPLLLDLLEYISTFSVDRPILLLCLARPDLFDVRPEWATPRPLSTTVRLEPLTSAETEALLETDTTVAADAALRRRILDAAGGVPLFVEQLAAFRSDGQADVPPTVRALLAARIDRLSDAERTVLERAAIQGEAFDRATVAALVDSGAEAPLATTLIGLVRREFIRPERSAAGAERFRFSHALLRDAVYEQMSRRSRAQLHQRFSEVLRSSDGDLELIGHQLERAHAEASVVAPSDPATTTIALEAGRALRAAGLRALARKEWQHGRGLLDRARVLLATEPAEELALLPDLLRAHGEQGDIEGAAKVHELVMARAVAGRDDSTQLLAEIEWTQLQMRSGDRELRLKVPEIAGRAVAYFRAAGDDASLAVALLLQITTPGMSLAEIIDLLREAQTHAERAGDERTQIEIWDELGGSMIYGPTPFPEILDFMRREIDWAAQRGIAFAEADGELGVAICVHAAGDGVRAREMYASVRALFAQLPGFVSQLGECDVLAAVVELEAGNLAAAETLYRRAMDVLERGGHVPWWTSAALGLVNVLVDLGQLDQASATLDTIDARGTFWSSRQVTHRLQVRAKLAAVDGSPDDALAYAREAVATVSDTDTPQPAARAHEVLGDLLARAGDAVGSVGELTLARDLYAAKGYIPGERRLSERLTALARG